MNYHSAIQAISCIISTCDPCDQGKIIDHIYMHSNQYLDMHARLKGQPTVDEIIDAITNNKRVPYRPEQKPEGRLKLSTCKCEYCKEKK